MQIDSIRPRNDNVLIRLDAHGVTEDVLTPGGIYIPQSAASSTAHGEAIIATVIAAGPGYSPDRYDGPELGTAPVGVTSFIPMDAAIVPGAKVLLERAALAGDRVYSDDHAEYRMIKAQCIAAVIDV